jgi:hypothetical protein
MARLAATGLLLATAGVATAAAVQATTITDSIAGSSSKPKGPPAMKAPPNLFLIVSDDLGFADLGYTGSSIKTPRIDALAKGGVILGHYYVNLCCSPTRAMLMTGADREGVVAQCVVRSTAF